ncbi:MAG: hypothetical protein EPO11_02290 [Gammaproteobacteria bacterium]|nr:MAG: hypothetical protein EPO11_02290 [Gammaproteobacteria bacterium]
MIGNLSMLMYALVTALSSILIHDTNQKITPLLSAFYTFLFCIIVYSIFSSGLIRKRDSIRKSWYAIFMLNLTTAICWIFTFYSLSLIPPDLFLFVYLTAMPIAASIIEKGNYTKTFLMLAGLILLVRAYNINSVLLGVILAFVGGISGTVYSIFSRKIIANFNTTEILSMRFYLTVITTFILSFTYGDMRLMDVEFYSRFALLSFISVIAPLILFQVGIKHLSLTRALSFLPLAPLVCYGINLINGNNQASLAQFIAVILLALGMLYR